MWLVDPLCGTMNFAVHNMLVSVNVALRTGTQVVVAASVDPFTDEVFWTDGAGANVRRGGVDERLVPSAKSGLVDVNLDPPFPNERVFLAAWVLADKGFIEQFRPRVVSTTLAVAWVAAGRRAAYITDGDLRDSVHFAAGIALCQAAGCVVTGIDGEPLHVGAEGLIVAADEETHAALLALVGNQRVGRSQSGGQGMPDNQVLRRALTAAGLTVDALAEHVGVDSKTVSRWITRGRVPHPRHRLAAAQKLGREVEELWPDPLRRASWLKPWVAIEREATSLRWFEQAVVPGLLQTERYARAVLCSGPLARDVDQFLAARLARQVATFEGRTSPILAKFVVDESVLRRGDPEVMSEQVAHLLAMGRRPGVFVHVLPLSAGLHPGQAGPFVLAGLPNGDTVAYLDDQASGRVMADQIAIADLVVTWETLCAVALPRDQSAELLTRMI